MLDDVLRLIPGYAPFATAKSSYFDEEAAARAIRFFHKCLRHVEGEKAGKPFILEHWQQAVIGNLFGWKRTDSHGRTVRRYREALIFVPRKNGKTPLVAGICVFMLFADPERGKQIYSAAGEKDQAALLYRHAKGMIEQEPELSKRARIYRAHKSIVRLDDEASVYRVLSADADTKHGGNPNLVIIDELHVQPNRNLVDALQTSMASANRPQPLLIHVTTSDFDRPSICNEKYDYACKVRDGIIEDESFLPVIYEADADADWTSEETWAKANPNLGVSVSLDYLRRECARAKETPTFENTFKRLHLNLRTRTDQKWLDLAEWDKGGSMIAEDELVGRPCYSGLDLSSKIDITAHVIVFPPYGEDKLWRIVPRLFVPADNALKREQRDRVPYEAWARQGWIKTTPGNVVDYEFVKASVLADGQKFGISEIAYDPWNATQIALQLQADGATVIEFGQGFRSMSEPAKELEKLVRQGLLAHGGNPVLRWMAANATIESDPAGNIKPSKRKSADKIDGIVALTMAIGRALAHPDDGGSVYDSRGIEFVEF